MEPDLFFKLIGDQTRLRCLALLIAHGELCVCELVEATGDSQPKISRHLALLRAGGVVDARRQGQWIFYHLSETLPSWALTSLQSAADGTCKTAPYVDDAKRFRRLAEPSELVA
ncbi:MAG: metalloregulator ArsR/SmtB family transcription factor [Alphaproteobacteria bacterium]|nr:metalloregulator ArsR/SmtB family transcription factor [Alphaproteobacteria bacterium]